MTLSVDLDHHLGAFRLNVQFESAGRLTALFGRSGSGKTSLVNIVAGLISPDRGRIAVDDKVLTDTAARVFVPTHRRRIGYVFQDARLFPHLSVRHNLLYGRWFTPRRRRHGDFSSVIDLLGIGHLLDRHPTLLSGGERQRVAIGRALLSSPKLLLMDEPLASLDDQRKAEILPYLERLRDELEIPIVYVSHSLAEVSRLATTIVVLDGGEVAATGAPAEIMQRLDLPALADAERGAVIDAEVVDHDPVYGLNRLAARAGEIRVAGPPLPPRTPVRLRIPAQDVMIATERPQGLSALNVLAGRVTEVTETAGPTVDIRIDCNGDTIRARLTRKSCHELGLAPEMPVFAVIKTVALDPASLGRAPSPISHLPGR